MEYISSTVVSLLYHESIVKWIDCFSLIGAIAIVLKLTWERYSCKLPPGPWGLPLIGACFRFGPNIHEDLTEMAKKYGDIFSMRLGSRQVVVLNGSDAIREAMIGKGAAFADRPDFYSFKAANKAGNSISLGAYTPHLRLLRKISLGAIHRFVHRNGDVLEGKLTRECERLVKNLRGKQRTPLDPRMPLRAATANVILGTLFGVDRDYDNEELRQILDISDRFRETIGSGAAVDIMPWLSVFPNPPVKRLCELLEMATNLMGKLYRDNKKYYSPGKIRNVADSFVKVMEEETMLMKGIDTNNNNNNCDDNNCDDNNNNCDDDNHNNCDDNNNNCDDNNNCDNDKNNYDDKNNNNNCDDDNNKCDDNNNNNCDDNNDNCDDNNNKNRGFGDNGEGYATYEYVEDEHNNNSEVDSLKPLISDSAMEGALVDLFGAGFDTTAITINWALAYLIKYPNIQRDIQREIDDVIGRERLPTSQDMGRLPLLEATIYELLRVTSIAPLALPHSTLTDTQLAGYEIPKGTVVFVNLWSLHRSERYWDEPDVFNPYRFIDNRGLVLDVKSLPGFLPFGSGRRQCPGRALALAEIFTFLAVLLHQFRFSQDELASKYQGINLQGCVGLTLSPETFYVHLEAR